MTAIGRWALVVLAIAGLAIDAYVHFDLASTYDQNATTTMSQGDLFRAEAIVAIVVGAALLLRPRWYTATLAVLTGLGGAALVAIYRYIDIGAFGPVPSMYEPIWFTEKTVSFVAEIVAGFAALVLLLTMTRASRSAGATHRAAPHPA